MSKSQKILAGLGLCLLCGVVLLSAFTKSDKSASGQPDTTSVVQNDWTQPLPAAAPSKVQTAQAIQQGPKLAAVAEGPDGKEVLPPDGKEVLAPDGKEVLPTDGKEVLPPVGELLPPGQPQAVNPGNFGPPTEFLNSTKDAPNNNQLLAPANPENVAGPVVSQETR